MERFGRKGRFIPKVCKRIRRKLKDDSKEDVDLYLLRKILDNTETIGKRTITYVFENKFSCIFEVLSDNEENQKKYFIVRNKEDFQQIVQKQRKRIPQLNKNDIKEDAPFSKRLEMLSLSEHKELLRLTQIITNKLFLFFWEDGKIVKQKRG